MRLLLKFLFALVKLAFIVIALVSVASLYLTHEFRTSVCYGTPSHGWLWGGKRPPMSGANYNSYSYLMWLFGRTAMHGAVRDTMVDAYNELAGTMPDAWYVYGEAGWPWGGHFPPHKTHRNGTSVDFFVPVRDTSGIATSVPIWPWNWMGYEVRFDEKGQRPGMAIDFEALAQHLDALLRAGEKYSVRIGRVILEADLHQKLLQSPTGKTLPGRIAFTHRAWVPHDNHYHIDFEVQCAR